MATTLQEEYKTELNNLIKTKRFDEAEQFVKTSSNVVDKSLSMYNLSLIQYKKGEYIDSRISLEKALNLGYYSKDALLLKKTLKSNLGVTYIEQTSSYRDISMDALLKVPKEIYPTVSLIFILVCLFSWNKIESISLKVCYIALVLAPLGIYNFSVKDHSHAVSYNKIAIYEGPANIFEKIQEVPAGFKFIISKEYGEWVMIESPSSFRGWIKSKEYIKL